MGNRKGIHPPEKLSKLSISFVLADPVYLEEQNKN